MCMTNLFSGGNPCYQVLIIFLVHFFRMEVLDHCPERSGWDISVGTTELKKRAGSGGILSTWTPAKPLFSSVHLLLHSSDVLFYNF